MVDLAMEGNVLFRCLRKRDTGQWIDVLFTEGDVDSTPEVFSTPELSHRANIAQALGVRPDELEVVDFPSDLRTGVLIEIPPAPAVRPTRLEVLLAIGRANWTMDEMREIIELLAPGH